MKLRDKFIDGFMAFVNGLHCGYRTKKRIIKFINIFILKKKTRKRLLDLIIHTDKNEVLFYKKNKTNFLYKRKAEIMYGKENKEYNNCSPSVASFIDIMIDNIKIEKDYIFCDVGSGGGYVLWKVNGYFKEVIGIELDKKAYEVSVKNLKKAKIKNYRIINDNILNISPEQIQNVNVFYLYNPFVGETMKYFLKTIEKSLILNDRDCYLVYINDVCNDIFEKFSDTFKLYKLVENKNWRDSRIYFHKSNNK